MKDKKRLFSHLARGAGLCAVLAAVSLVPSDGSAADPMVQLFDDFSNQVLDLAIAGQIFSIPPEAAQPCTPGPGCTCGGPGLPPCSGLADGSNPGSDNRSAGHDLPSHGRGATGVTNPGGGH